MSAIVEYWKSHPEYWIALGPRQAEADEDITTRFWGATVTDDDFVGRVIYKDQFMRHFSRVPRTGVTEADVLAAREDAAAEVKRRIAEVLTMDELCVYFCLMPIKHIEDYETVLCVIHNWIPKGKVLTDYPVLSRFHNDTYKKHYTEYKVERACVECYCGPYDPAEICDYYPEPTTASITPVLPTYADTMISALYSAYVDGGSHILSLSGGVDSMVMCALLKHAGLPFTAVHVVYGNRSTSEQEARFLYDYCKRLGVRLVFYNIPLLRRGFVEREFYESMTRTLRFMFYRVVGDAGARVFLGHIREDAIENVWTNLAKCTHLDDPVVLKAETEEEGVTVCRPWLGVKKEDIYAVAQAMGVPYLKNTTPEWSNRGKFRAGFYEATHAQYGASVDDKILETAAALQKQAALVHKLLYKPMLDSWDSDDRCCMITRGVEAELDGAGWSIFFTELCHTKLGMNKPSIHACGEFGSRIKRGFDGSLNIHMKKDLTVLVEKYDDDYVLIIRDTDHTKPLSID